MVRRGIIDPGTIKSGGAYASLEGSYNEPLEQIEITHLLLLNIYKFMVAELPDVEFRDYLKKKQEEFFANPDDFESTELGEIPAKQDVGGNGINAYKNYLTTFSLYEG
ncbi:MAG: hypothetical protein HC875_33415 [Anaerolineales bacterium]|nr:hypothetical protein [Anaerolineales bacterium]